MNCNEQVKCNIIKMTVLSKAFIVYQKKDVIHHLVDKVKKTLVELQNKTEPYQKFCLFGSYIIFHFFIHSIWHLSAKAILGGSL